MNKLLVAFALAGALLLPATARAGWIIEGSIGKGAKVSPEPVAATQSNFMLAPGITFIGDIVRLQVGLLNEIPDLKNSKYDLEVRPMLVVAPPILPVFARAIFAVTNLLNDKTTVAYGAAGGLKFGIGPVGVFAEAGVLPRSIASQINWVVEGRIGANLTF